MLILRILSWNSAPQPPLFLPLSCSTYLIKHLTHWKFQSIAVEPEILWKRWFAWAFCCCFFSCYAIFTWIWTYKTHDLTEYQLTIGSFLPATTFMWSDWQIPGDLSSSNSNCFPLCIPWSISNAQSFFQVSTLIFCVLIWQHQTFHTICFRIFTSPVMWSILEFAVLRPPQLISIVQSFSNPPPRVLVCVFCHSNHSGPLFSKLRSGCIRFNLKNSSSALPCLFQSLDYFESLLLESICPLPTLRTPPQDSLPTLGLAMTALPGLASATLSGLTAAVTSSIGCISSSLQPSEALLSIRDLLLVNLGPVKAAGAHWHRYWDSQ